MYHIVKIGENYLSENGDTVADRASALHVDAATFKAMKRRVSYGLEHMRLVTVTNRADRAARNVDSTSTADPSAAH